MAPDSVICGIFSPLISMCSDRFVFSSSSTLSTPLISIFSSNIAILTSMTICVQQSPPLLLMAIFFCSLPLWHQLQRNAYELPLSNFFPCPATSLWMNLSDDKEITPIFWRRCSNASRGRGFVKISTICSLELIYSKMMFCSATRSRRKWYLIGMCLVLECITGFLMRLIALMLSQ